MIDKDGKKLYSVFDKSTEPVVEEVDDSGDYVYDDYEEEEVNDKCCKTCDHYGTETDCQLYANFVPERSGWCSKIKGNVKIVKENHHCQGYSCEALNVLNRRTW